MSLPNIERDSWRTARAMLEEHRDRATFHAAQRADSLLAEGEFQGYRVWKRVLAAINAMRQPTPRAGERVN